MRFFVSLCRPVAMHGMSRQVSFLGQAHSPNTYCLLRLHFFNKRRNSGLFGLSALACITLLIACQKETDISHRNYFNKNILRFDLNAPISSLNPLKSNIDGGETWIYTLLYSYLMYPDEI
jgi:hypothetical protein